VSINISEVLVVVVVALLFIKPEDLPDTAYTLGKWLKWLRQTTDNVRREIEKPLETIPQEFPATAVRTPEPVEEKTHD
jgi:Sec-independent protein translocase protein TatA